jgi:hypothetical protein
VALLGPALGGLLLVGLLSISLLASSASLDRPLTLAASLPFVLPGADPVSSVPFSVSASVGRK